MRRLLEWKYMNPPTNNTAANNTSSNITTNTATTTSSSTSTSYPSQKDRYKKLIKQLERLYRVVVKDLTDSNLEADLTGLNTSRVVKILIIYDPSTTPPCYVIVVNNKRSTTYTDWNEVLELFEICGLIPDAKLCESKISSTDIPSKLSIDENILLDADEENSTEEYRGVIPCDTTKLTNIGDYKMKSLHEEFELYENMWDAEKATQKSFDVVITDLDDFKKFLADPENRAKYNAMDWRERYAFRKPVERTIEQPLKKHSGVGLSYDGFEDEWYEDRFDPFSSYGHYQTGGSRYISDFEYTISAEEAYEALVGEIIPDYAVGEFTLSTNKHADIVKEAVRLYDEYNENYSDTAKSDIDVLELNKFVVNNLDALIEVFTNILTEHFSEGAEAWARDRY